MDIIDKSPSQFDAILDEARACVAKESEQLDIANANRLVDKALSMEPESCAAWLVKCQVLSTAGDDTAALAAIEMALRSHPKSVEAQYWKAALLSDLDRHAEALLSVRRCFRYLSASDSWLLEDLYCEKAMILNALGNHDQAVVTYEEGLRKCPRSSLLSAGLAPLLRAKSRSQPTVARLSKI